MQKKVDLFNIKPEDWKKGFMKNFGTKLYELRMQQNLSQEKSCCLIGISRTSLRRYEQGEKLPTFEVFYKICEIYAVDMDYFANYSGKSFYSCMQEIYRFLEYFSSTLKDVIDNSNRFSLNDYCSTSVSTARSFKKEPSSQGIGKQIHKYCTKNGWNPDIISTATDVSLSSFSNFINGKKFPSIKFLFRFCELCGISVDEFIYPEVLRSELNQCKDFIEDISSYLEKFDGREK